MYSDCICVYNYDVVMGMFPVSQEKLLKLAALRLQYLDGDYSAGSIMYAYNNLFSVCVVYALSVLFDCFMYTHNICTWHCTIHRMCVCILCDWKQNLFPLILSFFFSL